MSCSDKLTTLLDAEGYAVEDKACLIEEIVMMDSDCPFCGSVVTYDEVADEFFCIDCGEVFEGDEVTENDDPSDLIHRPLRK